MKEKEMSVLLKIICASGAICTSVWCCYEYLKNEDMCEVYFKRFTEDKESIYPDLTLMLPHHIDEIALQREYGSDVNSSAFFQHLIGDIHDSHILNITLEKGIQVSQVTKSLKSQLISTCNISPFDQSWHY